MRSVKRALTGLLAALVVWSVAAAQDPIAELVRQAPSASDYPDDDGLILLERKVLDLREDGRLIETYNRVFKIFTQVGLNAYADPRFLYWHGDEQIHVVRARTFMRDGTVVPVPDNGYHDLVWSRVATAPDWLGIRQFVIDHTALEKQAVIDLEIRREGPASLRSSGVEVLQTRFPILKRVFEIRVPADSHLEYRSWPEPLEPTVFDSAGKRIHRWVLENVTPLPPAPQPSRLSTPALEIQYSFVDWSGWAKEMAEAIRGAASLGDAADSSLHRIAEGRGRGTRVVRGVRDWLDENVRTVDIDPALEGNRVRPASIVFETRYGTPLEKAVLLAAALQNLGVPAQVALGGPREKVSIHTACPALLSSPWVVATCDAGEIWVDPVRPPREAGLRRIGQRAVIFGAEKFTWHDFPPGDPEDNQLDLSLALHVGDDGRVRGEGTVRASGVFATGFELMNREEREKTVAGWIARSVSDAAVQLQEVHRVDSRNTELSFNLTLRDSLRRAGSLLALTLAGAWVTPSPDLYPKTPLPAGARWQLPAPFAESQEIVIEFPKEWELKAVSGSREIRNTVGRASLKVDQPAPDQLRIVRQLELEKSTLDESDVGPYLELLHLGDRVAERTVVFSRSTSE